MANDGNMVTELPEATSLTAEDLLYIVSSNTSKKITQNNIRNSLKSDELINIRTGADGSVYSSAGNAVRGQISEAGNDTKSINNTLIDGNSHLLGHWVNGYSNVTTGEILTNMNYRVTHGNWLSYPVDVTISVASGYSYNAFDDSFNLITSTTTADTLIPANTKFRINIRKAPEDTSIVADITAFSSAVTVGNIFDDIDTRLKSYFKIDDQALAAETDLNDVKTMGGYFMSASSTYYNCPIPTGNPRYLEVLKRVGASAVAQQITNFARGETYSRWYTITTGWGEWVKWETPIPATITNLDTHTHTIAHRGVPNITPAATKPSYVKVKEMGLIIAEGDIRFTSDNVPILFHDATYTVDGVTHVIANETYEQFMEYDIGAAFSPAFTGTYGLTLSEFLDLCNDLGLYPTIEFKTGTTAQVQQCLDIIDSKRAKVFNYKASIANLKTIIDHDNYASVRVGADDYSETLYNNLVNLLNYGNKLHQTHCIFAYGYGSWTSEQIARCRATGAIMGVSSINSNEKLLALTEDVDIIFTERGFNATLYKIVNAME